MQFHQIAPDVWLFNDSCNVYAVRGPQGFIIIDAGTGHWLNALDQLPGKVHALLLTHYFRDHSAGASLAAAQGIPVYAPEAEAHIHTNPLHHFSQRETWCIYDNNWDLFAPIAPTPLAGQLLDYTTITLAGLKIQILPAPGVTMTQSALAITLPSTSQRAVFCAEAIHSPGKLARIAPLQYNYNDLYGAFQCAWTAARLISHKPDALYPSLGKPITHAPIPALELLIQNLTTLCQDRPTLPPDLFAKIHEAPLKQISKHVYLDTSSWAFSWYIISDSGKALALDYGGFHPNHLRPAFAHRHTWRPVLHGMDWLKKQFGIDGIDTVLLSHFHDDHVAGVPLLQRLYNTKCWVPENFAPLMEHPEAHIFPCNWPVKLRIDKTLPLNQPFQWEEFTFNLWPMSGHTRFSALIGFEADGLRYAHTGDQYFFTKPGDNWAANTRAQNHVYRNGAFLDSYAHSGKAMLDWRPHVVLTGHAPAMFTDDAFFDHIKAWDTDFQSLHKLIMPLSDTDTHLEVDSWSGWAWPYRIHLPAPGQASFQATIRNPLPRDVTATLRLALPPGWSGPDVPLKLKARQEATATLHFHAATLCARQPIAIELLIDGQSYGQGIEAQVTVGPDTQLTCCPTPPL
jgi:glyoxylase-like metal-dependent hydrolase (beta-lactamase superfamily II)